MFDHWHFAKYSVKEIPLDRDLYLMDEKWIDEYEKSLLKFFKNGNYENVGYGGLATAAWQQLKASIIPELSFYYYADRQKILENSMI